MKYSPIPQKLNFSFTFPACEILDFLSTHSVFYIYFHFKSTLLDFHIDPSLFSDFSFSRLTLGLHTTQNLFLTTYNNFLTRLTNFYHAPTSHDHFSDFSSHFSPFDFFKIFLFQHYYAIPSDAFTTLLQLFTIFSRLLHPISITNLNLPVYNHPPVILFNFFLFMPYLALL